MSEVFLDFRSFFCYDREYITQRKGEYCLTSKKIRILVTAALFIALDIIMARLFSVEIPTPMGPLKADLQVVVAALCGYALGPVWGGITLVASDLLGVLLKSGSLGAFFGFTVSALLRGVLFGLMLHKRPVSQVRNAVAVGITFLVTDFFLNTVWLSMMMSAPFIPMLTTRVFTKLPVMFIDIAVILCLKKLFPVIRIGSGHEPQHSPHVITPPKE